MKPYVGRFYVLVVVCLLSLHHNSMWVTFSTIPEEASKDFNLSDDQITILAGTTNIWLCIHGRLYGLACFLLPETRPRHSRAYGPIPFIILTFPFMWFLEYFGLRVTMLISSWLLAVGCGMRCFVPTAPQGTYWTILFHIGHLLNGIVGVAVMTIPTRVSSLWFPPKERTWATAIATTAQPLGVALAFVTLPYLTRKYNIHTMLYVEAEIGLFVALLATIYFPPRPPTPPSVTAELERTDFKTSLKALILNKGFLVLAVSGGLFTGTHTGLTSVLSIILSDKTGYLDRVTVSSVQQFFYSIAWLGACRSSCGVLGGQVVGIIANRIQKRFKLMILVIITIAVLLAFWFAISIYGYTIKSPINIFITLCLLHFCNFATVPLYYEAAVEVTYPVPEGSSAGVLSILTNFSTLLFQIIALCKIFTTEHPERALVLCWVFGALLLLSGLLMLLFKETYRRLDVDIKGREYGNIQGQIYEHVMDPPELVDHLADQLNDPAGEEPDRIGYS